MNPLIRHPLHGNASGSFQELLRRSEARFDQVSLLVVNPTWERGNHYHTRKVEWFACLWGTCRLDMEHVETGERRSVRLDAKDVAFAEVTPKWAHKVVNDGDAPAGVLIAITEEFDPNDHDTHPFPVR